MKFGGVLWSLLGFNVALLGLFLWQGGRAHQAAAQQQYHHPHDYLMVPGEISGGPTEIVYMIDTTDGRLGAVTYDDASQTLQVMPAIDLNLVSQAGTTGKVH